MTYLYEALDKPTRLYIKQCPHCGKVGGGIAVMSRWHFDNCKSTPGTN
jgi:hypothetical protein